MAEPSAGPVGPDDHGAPLAGRLEGALHQRLDDAPVDVTGLLAGSHRRARRKRVTRGAMAGAAVVLALALPLGHELLVAGPSGTAADLPVAMMPRYSGDRVDPEDRASRSERDVPDIPDSVAFTPDDLPAGAVPEDVAGAETEVYARSKDSAGFATSTVWSPIAGVDCTVEAGHGPIQVRRWSWQVPTDDQRILLTVSRGSVQGATQVLTAVTARACAGQAEYPSPVEFTDGEQAVMFTEPSDRSARALMRVGGTVGMVEVLSISGNRQQDPEPATKLATTEAMRLAEVVADRLA